uniref:DIX domain-containing protein n=1 Tax=Helicotheca tamesis TaxID=374047 RepID=A0A7S2I1Q8_9STRA|mmetsp:Transcript_4895/g.6720  ORF Transcript_4895/g.6720 Transcript_4895/m.6720 type:complete len:300 (+) Transcript_4895:58-957(+)|eukprot:CAMPEP_0185726580 /NCGR_PEP_ID=MMETSP1171-20130828/2516_1 /TAXON_ID=374046 /ORGANISM="Helicotheca tamensis, Strain CCMP826" /LENGTH=299 /DNA_ID=CAMNT_0028394965 /DNA_START=39 /DNA_END=938 /DNA_ORIENTATION=-
MTTIRYFLPEDGDVEQHPNVFLAPKPSRPGAAPLLGQVKEAFPLPGKYHFRFKAPLFPGADREKGGMAVWMDCVDDSQHVSTFRGAIIAKVTRVGMDDEGYDDDDEEEFDGRVPTDNSTHSDPGVNGDPHLSIFDEPAAPSTNPPSNSSSVENLLHVDAPTPSPAAPAASGLLDLDAPVTASQPETPSTSHHADFMGMSATATHPTPTPPAPTPTPAPAVQPNIPQTSPMGGSVPMGASNPMMGGNTFKQSSPMSGGPRTSQQRSQGSAGRGPGGNKNNAFEAFSKKQDKGQFGSLRWG